MKTAPHAPTKGHAAPLEYHRGLIDDPHRVAAYDRAIRRLVCPGDVVLDLGAGTGLLSLLCARRGARVHALESMPVAGLAEALLRRNGLADRVTVHRGDAALVEPVEAVDLVVSEFMGRFLVDDEMLPAVAAARRWLKPGGRFCPSLVRMLCAPVGDFALGSVDRFAVPLLGLDLGAGLPYALNTCYHAQLGANALLAPAALYHDYHPLGPDRDFDHQLTFTLDRGGRMQGVAGWFEALLAPGVTLCTEPGIETHWGQYLFPVGPIDVQAGDVLRLRLATEAFVEDPAWQWEGELLRRGETIAAFEHESAQRLGERRDAPPPWPELDRDQALDWNDRAGEAYEQGDMATAASCYQEAVRRLAPADDDLAPAIYENLGLSLMGAGRIRAALQAFLRALDGDLGSREQSLRFLVACWAQAGHPHDAARAVQAYEAAFGPHPAGWTARALCPCCGGEPVRRAEPSL